MDYHLSRFSIKEFILERGDSSSNICKLSSDLFSFQDLTHLGFNHCSLKLPSTFKGFALLKSLHIQHVTVGKVVLENFIVGCPPLERMTLCVLDLTSLNIGAPNLQFLKVGGQFEEIQLKNSPNLVDVSLYRKSSKRKNASNLLQYVVSLPRIERLTIDGCFLECAVGSLPSELPEPCPCLKFLSISMSLNNLDDILISMSLMRSSPALRVLEIMVRQQNNGPAVEQASWLHKLWEFTQLRRLKVTGFSCFKGEVDFIEYLLSSSPSLRDLEIRDNKMLRVKGLVDVALGDYYNNRNCTFNQLRVIKVTDFHGVGAEAGFIRFLISSSPKLKKITLQPASAEVSWEVVKLVTEFMSNSGHLHLNFLNPPLW